MNLVKIATALVFCCTLPHLLAQSPDLAKLKQKPIAVGGGKVGDLLRQWWKEETAAGNAGDFYDNRDGDHSPMNLAPYPQLSAIKYSAEDIKLQRHWAAQRQILPHVTFGNSSTSAPAHLGGSNPRSYYVSPSGLLFLSNQYSRNNLYIYPEHRDHDPGHNGRGPGGEGYGDLYPTNTPYLIISHGSSGSDQPFMRMMPSVLAAFRPEVKAKLTEAGLLMPTIQMLFRSTNKHLKDPKEYLTAKAHPSVFEGSWVDELALVKAAHALELKSLPPAVQLRVIEEDKATNGIDFCDLVGSEVIANTPSCIARAHRSAAHTRRIVVNADASFDVNMQKLTYHWILFRGDPDKVKIVPKKDDQAIVEITVGYHERRPIAAGSPMESNRVEVGVFVHNGTHYSAPGFVTFHTFDREARIYDAKGKIVEIAHGMGETELRITDWAKMLTKLGKDEGIANLLKITPDERGILEHLGEVYQKRADAIAKAQAGVKDEEAALKDAMDKENAKKSLEAARKRVADAQKAATELLERNIDPLKGSIRHFVESRLTKLTQDPAFAQTHEKWLHQHRTPALEPRIASAWKKLVQFGLATTKEKLTPSSPGKWSAFERAQLEWLHANLLADVAFPGIVQPIWHRNYVDHRLSVAREWRDVYRYDPKEAPIGWTRYSADGVQTFNHEGLLVVEKDAQGRCLRGRIVRYAQDPAKAKGPNLNPLRAVLGDTIVRYEFENADDWRGRRAGMEPAPMEKK